MATTTVSLEEFQKDAEKVAEASMDGPVFITRPGRKTLVVLTAEDYGKLGGQEANILEILGHPKGIGAIEFEPPRMMEGYPREADFSD